MADPFSIARTSTGAELQFLPALANRHGLITGATGTGKTVTLQLLAGSFSGLGVPGVVRDGNVSTASIGAIQRALLEVEQQGAEKFFGEPMLDVDDLLQTDRQGRGMVNILAADELIRSPKVYSTFLLWMLSELFERLPEVG